MKQPHRISFRRTSWVLAIAFCLSALLATAAAASDLWASEPDVQTYRGYALDEKSEELVAGFWGYEQLTDEQLQLDTFYLARRVAKSAYVMEYTALSNFDYDGFYSRIVARLNGLRELETRADAAAALVAAREFYAGMDDDEKKQDGAAFAEAACEFLLSRAFYFDQLSLEDRREVFGDISESKEANFPFQAETEAGTIVQPHK